MWVENYRALLRCLQLCINCAAAAVGEKACLNIIEQ